MDIETTGGVHMRRLAEYSTSSPSGAADFLRSSYELNREPLRLLDAGQRWFARTVSHELGKVVPRSALVLGATPWLARLFRQYATSTVVVDASAAMLGLCSTLTTTPSGGEPSNLFPLHSDWLALPGSLKDLDLVAGDNAFNFLPYPEVWDRLVEDLANRMAPGGLLLSRLLAVPASHRPLHPAEIVLNAMAGRAPVNFTAVRASLLFTHWDSKTCTIRPEDALETFDRNRSLFSPLLCDTADSMENDLFAIEKYRGTEVTYFVPPLADAVAAFEKRFHVRAVHFGPYELSQYFPLVVASKHSE